jgi:hypothetical protein
LLLAADAKQFNIRISQCHLKVLRKMVSAWHSLFPFHFFIPLTLLLLLGLALDARDASLWHWPHFVCL